MFDSIRAWFRSSDPLPALRRRYEAALREARDLQRSGDIVGLAAKMQEVESIGRELDACERARGQGGGNCDPR
ncbi:MAG: hypothetical protein IT457_10960 [Planctomycetes bacterium]|nr:hypothetical protein [Planctomycetota bacterium]